MGFIPKTKLAAFLLSIGVQLVVNILFAVLAYYHIPPFSYLQQVIFQLIDGVRKNYLPDLDPSLDKNEITKYQNALGRMNKVFYVMFNVIFWANFTNLLNLFPILMVPQLCLFIISTFFCLMIALAMVHSGWGVVLSFAPKGIPKILVPILYLINFLSFCIKPFIFTIRLVLSYIVGHKFMDVISKLMPQKLLIVREIIIFLFKIIELAMLTLQIYLLVHLMYYSYSSLVKGSIPSSENKEN
jgi:hypothetical protein